MQPSFCEVLVGMCCEVPVIIVNANETLPNSLVGSGSVDSLEMISLIKESEDRDTISGKFTKS